MSQPPSHSILLVKGETLEGSPLADKIIALDRKNVEPILKAVGLDFDIVVDRRRMTLFHPSNRIIVATNAEEVVGYVDYCDGLTEGLRLPLSFKLDLKIYIFHHFKLRPHTGVDRFSNFFYPTS